MKKWIAAAFVTFIVLAGVTNGSGPTPAAAAGPDDVVDTGSCRYYCSSSDVSYTTHAKCTAACGGGFCEPVC